MDLTVQQHMQTAVIAIRDNRTQDAIALLTTIIDEASTSETHDVEMFARGLRAPTFAAVGNRPEAIADARRALALATSLRDKESVTHYAALLVELGDTAPAAPAAPVSEPTGQDLVTPRTDPLQAASEALMAGDTARAIQILEPLIAFAQAGKSVIVEASASGMLAQALMLDGNLPRAREFAIKARDLAATQGDPSAIEHFETLLETLKDEDVTEVTVARARAAAAVHAAVHRAGEQLDAGDAEGALQTVYPILTAAKDHGLEGAEATLRGLTAQAMLRLGRNDDAANEATKALRIAQKLGDDNAVTGFRRLLEMAFGLGPKMADA